MTTPNPDLSGVLRRIQKLLAIANDHRANPEEAAAAASMAEKIMRKFQLDHMDLVREELRKNTNFTSKTVFCRMKMHNPVPPVKVVLWAQFIAASVMEFTETSCVKVFTPQGAGLQFRGYAADVQVACFMFEFLTQSVIRSCRNFQRDARRSKADSESFRKGFVMGLNDALCAAIAAKAAEQSASTDSRALVVLKKEAVEEHFGKTKTREAKAPVIKSPKAFAAGLEEAAKVDVLRRAVEGSVDADDAAPRLLLA